MFTQSWVLFCGWNPPEKSTEISLETLFYHGFVIFTNTSFFYSFPYLEYYYSVRQFGMRTVMAFLPILRYHMPSYIALGSMVPELHDMRIVRSLKTVTPACVTKLVLFLLQIDCIRYHGSFEPLQVEVKFHLSVEPAGALNKLYSACAGPMMYRSYKLLRFAR